MRGVGFAALGRGLLHALYPPQCLCCEKLVDRDGALCGSCWRETAFLGPGGCQFCGLPLLQAEEAGTGFSPPLPSLPLLCEDCHRLSPPWSRGTAVMSYGETARRLILALKYGDRMELARPMAQWMARAAAPLLLPEMVVVPVPLHWRRLWTRRYNQAALLSKALARRIGLAHCPDALIRPRATGSQVGRSREARFAALEGAFRPHPRRGEVMAGRPVLLVDDVMTSGATFTHATKACLAAGASQVAILALARVAKNA